MVNVAQHIPNVKINTWETENYYAVDSWISYSKPIRTSDAKGGKFPVTLEHFEDDYLPSSIYITEGTAAASCLNPELITINTSLSPTAIHSKTTNNINQQWQ
jgi:hypothetical protein